MRSHRWWLVAQVAGGALFGATAAVVGIPWLAPWLDRLSLPWPVMLVLVPVLMWVHVLLHEGGHALAGHARGMRALAYGVGPVRLERGTGGWHWRWGGGMRGISGFAALLPGPGRRMRTVDQAWFLFGGPVANLVLGVVAAALAARLGPGAPADVLWLLAGIGVAIGVLNLVPFRSSGWRSDGLGLLELLRGAPEAALQLQASQLPALSLAGVRPRDWPVELVPALPATDAGPSPLQVNAILLRLNWAMDRRDVAESEAAAAAAAAGYWASAEVLRPYVAVNVASHAVVIARDPALLRAWRPLCEGSLLDLSPQRAWLDAEMAAAAGDCESALVHAGVARAALARVHDAAGAAVLAGHLDALEARLGRAVPGRDQRLSQVAPQRV